MANGPNHVLNKSSAHWYENPFFGNLSFLSFLIKVIVNGSEKSVSYTHLTLPTTPYV